MYGNFASQPEIRSEFPQASRREFAETANSQPVIWQ
jgi:hypothetical protein